MLLRLGYQGTRYSSCSFLGAEEGGTLELPIKLGLHANGQSISFVLITFSLRVRSEPDSGDKVFVVALGVFVYRTAVVSLLWVELLAATATRRRTLVISRGSCRHCGDMNDREGLIWILRSRIFKSLLIPGPGSAFQVKTVNADTFSWNSELLLDAAILTSNDFLLDLCLGFDRVEGPLLFRVLSGDLLQGSRQETLRIVETSEPEGDGALSTS